MPARSDGWGWFIRGYLTAYSIYILSHAMADFLVKGLPPIPFSLVVFVIMLPALAVAFRARLLVAVGAAATTSLIIIYREYTYLWLTIRQAPSEIWDVIYQGWLGTITEVPLLAAWPLVGLTAFLSALVLGWWMAGRVHRWTPTVVGMTMLMVQWFFYHDAAREYAALFLPAALAMAAVSGDLPVLRVRGAVYAAGLATVVLAVSGVFPDPPGIWDWGKVGDLARSVVPALSELRGERDPDFSLPGAGWNGDGESRDLGGPVDPSDRTMLTVTVDAPRFPGVMYLRGSVATTYDGRTWHEDGDREPVEDSKDIPMEFFGGESYTLTKHVRMANMTSRTLFGLWRVEKVETDRDLLIGSETSLHFDEPRRRGDAYRVTSQVPMVNEDQLRRAVEEAGQEIPGEFSRYLQLPDAVPERVHELARELTEDKEHLYDQALAIEKYLRTIDYNLDAPAPPAEREFVDFFLFDAQEGYCTYHSSAMAVMLRSVGIPTRWVQGFRLQIPGDDEFMDDAWDRGAISLIARGSDAHAWVEAYFPGYGWLIMEATSGFEGPVRLLGDFDQPVAPDDPGPGTEDRGIDLRVLSAQILLALLLAGAFATAAVAIRRVYQPSPEPSTPRESIMELYHQASRLLEGTGSPREKFFTPSEYAREVEARPAWPAFAQLTDLYERAAYSSHRLGSGEAEMASALKDEVFASVKVERGTMRFALSRLR